MRCNIYEDQFQSAEIFGKPVLYTEKQVPREAVPDGWHCYDLTGTDREPDRPAALEDRMPWLRVGTVLSPVSLKRKNTLARRINNSFSLHEELLDLAGFCEKNHLECPSDPRKFILRPASHQEAGLFYSRMEPEQDVELGTIGHLRFDFGGGGFHHSWWPHNDDRFNTLEFKAALQEFVDELRTRGPLQSDAAMRRWCYGYPEGEIGREQVGFEAETEDYRFCLRCTTMNGDYGYIYCYDLNQQRLAMAQAEPDKAMTMGGYVLMNDLHQAAAARDEFQLWLELGHAPLTIWQGEKAQVMLSRLEKKPSVDYLYRIAATQGNSISREDNMLFCGVYDMKNRALYLTKDSLRILTEGKFPMVPEAGPSMAGEISGKINQRVESIIANDRDNLPVREVTGWREVRDLRYYQEYGVAEDAIQHLFNGTEPDGQFHSDYELDRLPEAGFLAYIQDPEGFIQTKAEQYIQTNAEKFLLQFLENDALLAKYQTLMQDVGNPIHRMKAITDAINASGAKTVTVTIQKAGQELTFKAAASSLTGHKSSYSTYDINGSDRLEFDRTFGRYSDYTAEDITRITYGRRTIYEAAPAQAESMERGMEMGGCKWTGYRENGWSSCGSSSRRAAGSSSERRKTISAR